MVLKTFALSTLLVGATLAVDPAMEVSQSIELSTSLDRVASMDKDASFVYAALATKVVKMNPATLSDYSTEDLGAKLGVTEITSLRVDDTHVFVTAAIDQTWKMYKLDKTSMEVKCTYVYASDENIPYSMQHDGAHVYTGMYTSPGKIVRISKSDCTRNGDALELEQGEDDIRAMEYDAASDATHLYANTNTAPGRVVKVDLGSFTRAGGLTLNDGENYLLSGSEQDADNIYVGTNTNPGRIVKVAKADMTRVGAATLRGNEHSIISMESDLTHIYAPTYSTPPRMVRVHKDTMTREDAKVFDATFTAGISSVVHVGEHIIVGVDSAPASFAAVSGYLQPNDCAMNAWTPYGACDRGVKRDDGLVCGMGVETRTRTEKTQPTNGGKTCPTELTQTKQCGHGVCPLECSKGTFKVWAADSESATPTCTNRTPTSTKTGTGACQCPPDKPYWHAESVCISAADCDKDMVKCTDTTCIYENGKLQVHHPHSAGPTVLGVAPASPENGQGGFMCHHTPGRTGACLCLCHAKSDSPSDSTYPNMHVNPNVGDPPTPAPMSL